MPIGGGFWCSWLPLALPQRWPFCWWVAVIVDHFSRRVLGAATFFCQPSSNAVRSFLGRTIQNVGAAPKYIVCDRGPQFDNSRFRKWCRRNRIRPPRYGALGQHGSIAVVERCIRTLKENLRCLAAVSYSRRSLQRELNLIAE
ncbi:MAG TPA: transposase family protein [Pirellulales bacterium]|nr:transposase family protein [Pirellulales bacterium]